MNRLLLVMAWASTAVVGSRALAAEKLCDHEVVLDRNGKLLPWTSFDNVIKWSMNYIEHCPTTATKFSNDPWYLVTSKLTDKAQFLANQNCQGSHAYWGVETLIRYYPYSGDVKAIKCIRLILDRVLHYRTPSDWAWPNVPRTQDNTPDGQYTDLTSESDKICMVGIACIKFYKLTGEEEYLQAARGIAKTITAHVSEGDATHSPLPFRVDLKGGQVLDPYTSHMVAPVAFFEELIRLGETGNGVYPANRDLIWKWVLNYPVKNNRWIGYYEDVPSTAKNATDLNQQSPMETARFMLRYPEMDPDWRQHVPALIAWVENRFGKTKRCGATSIKEQDLCNMEMGSHTSRYASIVAKWFGITHNPKDREEARASFALATYSAYSKYSKGDRAVNYVGVGYVNPWFVDSYFDYLAHILDGMSELPEMAPANADHILGSDSIIKKAVYQPGRIEYTTFEPGGNEILRIIFPPKAVMADGQPLPTKDWIYGTYRGVSGVLRIYRNSARNITVLAQ